MAKECLYENMTVDAEVCGDIREVEGYDGAKRLIAADYREIRPQQIYCGDCGAYIDVTHGADIHDAVQAHLKEE